MGTWQLKVPERFGFISVAGTLTAMAMSQPAHSTEINELAHQLLSWVVEHSDLEPSPVPEIHLAPQSSIALTDQNGEFGNVIAMYDIENGVVLLSEGWDLQSPRDQSILLHELVHHLQISNGILMPCIAHLNFLAYSLQLEWLDEIGIEDAQALIRVNDAMIFQRSACADPFGTLPWE